MASKEEGTACGDAFRWGSLRIVAGGLGGGHCCWSLGWKSRLFTDQVGGLGDDWLSPLRGSQFPIHPPKSVMGCEACGRLLV